MDNVRTARHRVAALALTLALVAGLTLQSSPGPASGSPAAHSDLVAVVVQGASVTEAARAVTDVGGSVDRALDLVGGVAARVPDATLATLRARPGVQVALDVPFTVSSAGHGATKASSPAETGTSSPAATTTTGQLAAMHLGERWSRETGAGVGVALIDTGVTEIPELAGRIVHGPDYSGDGDGIDRHGHGTFMAGLIAADSTDTTGEHDGVAPGAHIVSLKLAGRDGVTSLSKVLDAIGWVVVNRDEYGIRVLNLSLGARTNRAPQADPLSAAVQAAWASGITVVAAAGNEGAGTVTSPGRDPWVITVGATDTNDTPTPADDTVPDWSGSDTIKRTHKAELLAPGAGVVSLRVPGSTIDEAYPDARVGDAHFRGSGTSMSTALVSGAVAALAEFRPLYATPDDLKGALVAAGAPVEGTTARAVDVAAADELDADPAWRQDHRIAFNRLDGQLRDGMPWSQPSAPTVDETWARMSWADGAWTRMSWAEADLARMSWARMSWARMSWADTDLARMSWARMSWAEANLARMSWADLHVTRMSWARMSWARMSWARMSWAGHGFATLPGFDRPEGNTGSWDGSAAP